MLPKIYEKRKYNRLPVAIPCHIMTGSLQKNSGNGYIVNYSLGGLGIESPLDIHDGTPVIIAFNLDSNDYEVRCMILYKNRITRDLFHYGIKYTDLNIIKIIKLNGTINKHLEKETAGVNIRYA